jgi:hypothetical protein
MCNHPAEPKQINLCTEAEMSGSNLAVLARRNFPQFPKWPKSVQDDQSAIEQARRELGPDADAKQILARAQEIKERGKEKQAITVAWYQVPGRTGKESGVRRVGDEPMSNFPKPVGAAGLEFDGIWVLPGCGTVGAFGFCEIRRLKFFCLIRGR